MNHYPAYPHGALDAETQAFLDGLLVSGVDPLWTQAPAQARLRSFPGEWLGPTQPMAESLDCAIPVEDCELRAKLYRPRSRVTLPVLIYFHGGGFVVGGIDETEAFCTTIASSGGCAVLSVDYRLAPEHRWPAAEHDALAAVDWIARHAADLDVDARRMAVAGNSAGANLAAQVALRLRDRGASPLLLQVLICPWLDLAGTRSESFHWFGQGPWLSATTIDWFRLHYLEQLQNARRASPLHVENLENVPPALIIAAEFDVLRTQAEEFAQQLLHRGNDVECEIYPGTIHDFPLFPGLFGKAAQATERIAARLAAAFEREVR